MEYRRAKKTDFDQILELQQANLLSTLNPNELSDGFLNRAYTRDEFHLMNENIAVIVAVDNKIRGYLCAASLAFNQQFPFPAALFKQAAEIKYHHRVLTSYSCCLVNPICIEKTYRGGDVFIGLCQTMLPFLLSSNYEIALAFVSTANQRSLHACQKLMQICGQFSLDSYSFWILMRDLRGDYVKLHGA